MFDLFTESQLSSKRYLASETSEYTGTIRSDYIFTSDIPQLGPSTKSLIIHGKEGSDLISGRTKST